jgi:hypothetical protein
VERNITNNELARLRIDADILADSWLLIEPVRVRPFGYFGGSFGRFIFGRLAKCASTPSDHGEARGKG